MSASNSCIALGLDFGTESVRALLVTLAGEVAASATAPYPYGQITRQLPSTGKPLPPEFALQDPDDWIMSSAKAVKAALKQSGISSDDVLSIGVDFTSCTMLSALADGTPLCQVNELADNPYAWPKLWKHHAAQSQTDRINAKARERNEAWLPRDGGIVGLEWFFPKVLETFEQAPKVYAAAEVWLEAGDWYVWQLTGGSSSELARSTCQAGYKAMWTADVGYPRRDFFNSLDPKLGKTLFAKLPGRFVPPGEPAGELCPAMAKKLGLKPGIPVSAAVIDAHAAVPGAGVAAADTLVMVLGTSSCHMLNSAVERFVPGVAGVVQDGILPGFYGYETGQASVGDAFDWLRRLSGQRDFKHLDAAAANLSPGADGVLALDWLNGCRTPLMDGSLAGAFTGLKLHHGPEHLYRALIEATACGVRWIVELLEAGGVPVKHCVATGGLPHHNPLLVQIYANVLGRPIEIAASKQGSALGAAILGVLAAGAKRSGFRSPAAAIQKMAGGDAASRKSRTVKPALPDVRAYDTIYRRYRELTDWTARQKE